MKLRFLFWIADCMIWLSNQKSEVPCPLILRSVSRVHQKQFSCVRCLSLERRHFVKSNRNRLCGPECDVWLCTVMRGACSVLSYLWGIFDIDDVSGVLTYGAWTAVTVTMTTAVFWNMRHALCRNCIFLWRWRQQVSAKLWQVSSRLYDIAPYSWLCCLLQVWGLWLSILWQVC
jgi:hypothetical protein